MGIVNLILNLAGLLLWLSWTSMKVGEPTTGTPRTLLGTLRRAEPVRMRRWYFLAAVLLLLFGRALLYWLVSGSLEWTPGLELGGYALAFRADRAEDFSRCLAFSFLSFAVTLAVFYLWLLLLAALNARPASPDPFGKLVRLLLGPLNRLNVWLKLLLPLLVAVALWLPLSWYLAWIGVVPPASSWLQRAQQGLLVGIGLCLTWRYLLSAVLVFHLLNTYVYLGEHPFWAYVSALSRPLLQPLRRWRLQSGKVDFAPVIALIIVLLTAEGVEYLLFDRQAERGRNLEGVRIGLVTPPAVSPRRACPAPARFAPEVRPGAVPSIAGRW